MIASILTIIGAILSIVEINLRRKYIDQYLNLQKAYHDEINKPDNERDDSNLDELTFQLQLLANAIASDVAASKNATPITG